MVQMEPTTVSRQSTMESTVPNFPGVYHIYHTGKNETSYSIHAVSDSKAIIKLDGGSVNPPEASEQDPKTKEKPIVRRQSTFSRMALKMKRAKAYDDPRYDPRTESSPYFIHMPTLAFHLPPYTLRHGGTKGAPVAALMHPALGWRSWKLEFGDILSQDGVIDGRGVVGLKYGTAMGEDGTLRGYAVRSFRLLGESGKAWFKEQKALKTPPAQSPIKAKPEEVVDLKWVSPFSTRTREYHFNWRGYNFVWKGTGKAQTKKLFRPMLRFNHLKLVVIIPSEEDKSTKELTLARYTSVMSSRKMGRLELDQEVINIFLTEYILDASEPSPEQKDPANEKSPQEENSETEAVRGQAMDKVHRRMEDIIVSTGMSMIIGEYQKRQVIIALILVAIEGAPG